MRIYIYNIQSFPSNISIHVTTTAFSPSQVLSEVKTRSGNPNITSLFDLNGNRLEGLSENQHGAIYFAHTEDKLPKNFHSYVTKAHMDRVDILTKKEIKLDIVEMVILGLLTFYISWFLTNGGVTAALPLCVYLAYACFRKAPEYFESTIRHNLHRIAKTDRKMLYVIAVWLLLKVAVESFLPQSSGTSPNLVIFSIALSMFYLVPRVLSWWLTLLKNRRLAPCYFFYPVKRHYYLSVLAILLLALMVVFDLYFTSFFTLSTNKKCGLLLITESKHLNDTMNALRGISQLIKINQFNTFESLLQFSTGLGEVERILPVLITLAVFTQFVVPKQYELVRHLFFRAVLSQVVGGLISAAMKITIHRFRPNAYGDPWWFTGPGLQVINHLKFSKLDLSFPCGHATVTFAACYVLYRGVLAFINNNRPNYQPSTMMKLALGVVIFIFPTFTGLSRVVRCKHWASDVLAGFLLGICVGSWAVGNNFDLVDELPKALGKGMKEKKNLVKSKIDCDVHNKIRI